jgi:hypothetical protein
MNDNNKHQKIAVVDVQYALDGKGNSTDGRYQVSCDPDNITVGDKNTTIVYELSGTTPEGIVFNGYTQTPAGQLAKPSISQDGRVMSINDSNTIKEVFKLTLLFKDNAVFGFDPEVTNNPVPS